MHKPEPVLENETNNFFFNLTKFNKTNRNEWSGKVINRELCKRLKFDHADKWYMHKPEAVLENETHKIFWDFEIQKNPPNPDQKTRPRVNLRKKKRSCRLVDLVTPADYRVKMKMKDT